MRSQGDRTLPSPSLPPSPSLSLSAFSSAPRRPPPPHTHTHAPPIPSYVHHRVLLSPSEEERWFPIRKLADVLQEGDCQMTRGGGVQTYVE